MEWKDWDNPNTKTGIRNLEANGFLFFVYFLNKFKFIRSHRNWDTGKWLLTHGKRDQKLMQNKFAGS